jgi:ABC-2 type transport system ATP-binding protein
MWLTTRPPRRNIVIKAEHLTKRYGQHVAIDDISFAVEQGEIVGFLGPNGAGKTTTMNIITGYLSASEGRVQVADYDVLDNPTEVKKRIGYLPENPPVYPEMTVDEFLTFVGRIKKVPKAQAKEDIGRILELVKIADVRKRLIRNLSKGYKQRVGLAQALMGNPDVLILDEPTVGLDPKQIIEIRSLITELREDHTIILSSHILPEVSAVCERILIVNQGNLVADDTPDNLGKRLAGGNHLMLRVGATAQETESAIGELDSVRTVRTTESPEPDTVDVVVEAHEGADIRRDVFSALSSANLPILLMRTMDVTLEDIFLQLTTTEKEVS